MTDEKTTTRKKRDLVGDDSPAPKKSGEGKKAAADAKKATAAAEKNIDDSYKDKPDLVGDGEPRKPRGRPKSDPVPDPLKDAQGDNSTTVVGAELKQFLERMERLEEEKKAISDDMKDLKAELKGRGFDVKTFTRMLKVRKMDHGEFMEQEAMFELYMNAIGM